MMVNTLKLVFLCMDHGAETWAELHDTSQGGIALLDHTGWFMEPDYLGVESCYDKLEYCPALSKVKAWDFKKYQRR